MSDEIKPSNNDYSEYYEYNEYKNGAIIGISQTILGHPLDTLKTWKQNGSKRSIKYNISNMYTKYNIPNIYNSCKTLYRGISYPLAISIGYNSFLFGFYTKMKSFDYSSFQAGVISGSILGITLNPFEYYKIQRQIGYTGPININKSIFRGLHYTIGRESIACGLYFTTYEYFTEYIGLNAFVSGGISGCTSWAFTYPIDTVKTRFQANPSYSGKYYLLQGGLFKGIGFCLLRAFLVNGVSFTLYEMME